MTDKLFNTLWGDALAEPNRDMFIGGYGLPDWFYDIHPNPEVVVEFLSQLHAAAHMNIREMIKSQGLSIAKFATKFCIPYRTAQDWVIGNRRCADYIRLMLAKELGILIIPEYPGSAENENS